jgi:hypothetical protein
VQVIYPQQRRENTLLANKKLPHQRHMDPWTHVQATTCKEAHSQPMGERHTGSTWIHGPTIKSKPTQTHQTQADPRSRAHMSATSRRGGPTGPRWVRPAWGSGRTPSGSPGLQLPRVASSWCPKTISARVRRSYPRETDLLEAYK